MPYASIREVRAYNGWSPLQVKGEVLERLSDTEFRASRKPIVDYDYDGDLLDDVKVYVDGASAGIASIDSDRGVITLQDPVAEGSTVTADYYWHPIGDDEIKLAIAEAEAEIESKTGIKFEPHSKVEEIILNYGSEFNVSEPIISITSIKHLYDDSYKELGSDEYEIVDKETGRIRLKNIIAGVAVPPWYLPLRVRLRVEYTAGYETVPDMVKHAAILIASYQVLLRIQRQISFSEDYTAITVAFKTPNELTERLEFLRAEVERVKDMLPRRVAKI